jgi:hypothetical protein
MVMMIIMGKKWILDWQISPVLRPRKKMLSHFSAPQFFWRRRRWRRFVARRATETWRRPNRPDRPSHLSRPSPVQTNI